MYSLSWCFQRLTRGSFAFWICQTLAASPAKLGGLPVGLEILWSALLCCLQDQTLSAQLKADEIRSRIASVQEMIRSIEVTYSTSSYSPEIPVSGAHFRKEIAAKAPGFLRIRGSHGHDGLEYQHDPTEQIAYLSDNRIETYYPFDQTVIEAPVAPDDAPPGTLSNEFFFVLTGVWPLQRRPAPQGDGHPIALRDVARSDSYSVVRSELERVDDRWCHVLEFPRHDVLWIDVERGCSLVARELLDEATGGVRSRFVLSHRKEVLPGVWLPRELRAHWKSIGDERVVDAKVTHLSVNMVESSRFNLVEVPGLLRVQFNGREDYQFSQVPGGVELLDNLVDRMKTLRDNVGASAPRNVYRLLRELTLGLVILIVSASVLRSVVPKRYRGKAFCPWWLS